MRNKNYQRTVWAESSRQDNWVSGNPKRERVEWRLNLKEREGGTHRAFWMFIFKPWNTFGHWGDFHGYLGDDTCPSVRVLTHDGYVHDIHVDESCGTLAQRKVLT